MRKLFNLFQVQPTASTAPHVAPSPDSLANRGSPPASIFGSSKSFGGTGEPISQREAVARISAMDLAFNGADPHGLTFFNNGRVSAAGLGYYQVVGKNDEKGDHSEHALIFALRPQHLYLSEENDTSSFQGNAYLVNAYALEDGHWPEAYPDLLRHSVEARRVLAANMLFRTGVGVYQSATVSYRMVPVKDSADGEPQVRVELYSRDYHDEKFEPTDLSGMSPVQRLLSRPHTLGTVPYRDAERGIAADFARRQDRIAAGKDPLTLWERAKNPRQIVKRVWVMGKDQMEKKHLSNWSNPRVIATNVVRAAVSVAKFVLSGAGSLLEKAVETTGSLLGALVDPDMGYREYYLRPHKWLRTYSKPHTGKSFLNRVLLPLNPKTFTGFQPLNRDEAAIAPYAPDAPGMAHTDPRNDELEFFRQPFSAPGSLVKFWNGKGGYSSITFQRPSGIRFDYLIGPGGKKVEGIYARYLPDWRVEEPDKSPARAWAQANLPRWLQKGLRLHSTFTAHAISPDVAAAFEAGKVLRVLDVSNGQLWREQVTLEQFEEAMRAARSGNKYEETVCPLADRPRLRAGTGTGPS